MPVTVLWGNDRFQFDLPSPQTTLAAIRQSIAAYTQLPLDNFKLIHDGAVMKDDNLPISVYYLRPNSTISLVTVSPDQPAAFRNTEQVQVATIQSELTTVRDTLIPAHAQFLLNLNASSKPSLNKEHSRISELLLQSLLRVDAVVPERDWEIARATRKAAVKELQGLLDQLDSAWVAT